ncbi:MAG: VIT1/CCC1 transporter family protein, partial [Acidimicrobiales bacterium]
RREIQQFPEAEHRELTGIYQSRGIDHDLAHQLASVVMSDEDLAVETHAREELGINQSSLGSAIAAAASSFATFALGAAVPLVPWLVTSGAAAVVATVVAAGLLAIVVGGALGIFTGRSPVRSAFRQLALSTVAAAIAFGVGNAARGAGFR